MKAIVIVLLCTALSGCAAFQNPEFQEFIHNFNLYQMTR